MALRRTLQSLSLLLPPCPQYLFFRHHRRAVNAPVPGIKSSMADALLRITCHCGQAAQSVRPRSESESALALALALCHCTSCRRATGQLCASYYPLAADGAVSLAGLTAHRGQTATRYFCSRCGCHVFIWWPTAAATAGPWPPAPSCPSRSSTPTCPLAGTSTSATPWTAACPPGSRAWPAAAPKQKQRRQQQQQQQQ